MLFSRGRKDCEEARTVAIEIRIRERCLERGLTTAYKLQKAADLAPATASRLFNNEVGYLTRETLDKLTDALDCELSVLFPRVRLKGKK
jgi:DNA-binding Xre family transcriptional regulator